MSRSERGFVLLEALCAVTIVSLTIMLATALWHASIRQERQSELHFLVSRIAVSQMERIGEAQSIAAVERTNELEILGVSVEERLLVEREGQIYRVVLTYSWLEGGRAHAQSWATLHL